MNNEFHRLPFRSFEVRNGIALLRWGQPANLVVHLTNGLWLPRWLFRRAQRIGCRRALERYRDAQRALVGRLMRVKRRHLERQLEKFDRFQQGIHHAATHQVMNRHLSRYLDLHYRRTHEVAPRLPHEMMELQRIIELLVHLPKLDLAVEVQETK